MSGIRSCSSEHAIQTEMGYPEIQGNKLAGARGGSSGTGRGRGQSCARLLRLDRRIPIGDKVTHANEADTYVHAHIKGIS